MLDKTPLLGSGRDPPSCNKMETIDWETAFQIVLRNCSKEVGGKIGIYVILVTGEYIQSGTFFF